MMQEFTISFRYNNKDQKAGVLMSVSDNKATEYDVRPVDPFIVKKFGHQIRIFRIKEFYNTHNHIARDYKDFFNSLVNAIRSRQDLIFKT